MRWDFWNNPLVVSAFRVKYRAGGPWLASVAWMLALCGLGYLIERNFDGFQGRGGPGGVRYDDWYRAYAAVLFGAQTLLSAVLAYGAVHSSMQTEVSTRTMDFQRIAGVSPAGILQGKLCGEAFTAFFLMGGSFPLALFCMFKGALPADVLVLMYVNIATTIVLAGSMGLVHSLHAVPGKAATGAGSIWIAVFITAGPIFGVLNSMLRTGQAGQAAATAFAPIAQIAALGKGEGAWAPKLSMFSGEIPCLVATPLLQLCLASIPLLAMARRLRNPLNISFTKIGFLVRLLALDLFLGAVLWPLYALKQGGAEAVQLPFWIPHLLALLFGALATPGLGLVYDWVWRQDGKPAGLREALLGERAPTTWWAPVAAATGVLGYVLFVLMPMSRANGVPVADLFDAALGWRLATIFAVSWAYLALVQAIALLGPGPVLAGFAAAVGLGVWTGVTSLAGWRFGQPWLFALGLPGAFGEQMQATFMAGDSGGIFGSVPVPPGPGIAAHLAIALLATWPPLRYVAGVRAIVTGRLVRMGVLPVPAG